MIEWAKFTESGNVEVSIDGAVWMVAHNGSGSVSMAISEWEADGNIISPYIATGPTVEDVNSERDRRINIGFTFNGVVYDSDDKARENIAGAATAALGGIIAGKQDGDFRWSNDYSDFEWIAQNNSFVPMDAQTTFAFGQAAMKHKQDLIMAARAIKDIGPIPEDYKDDIHWP
jgi:hypothetical protein